ncbi:MAG: hypothetical protein U0800_27780 [Isosphaeraceae bacterium]
MFVIRSDQQLALEAAARAPFHARVLAFLRSTLDDRTRHRTDSELLGLIEAGDRQATALGLRTERGIAQFVALTLMLGPQFPEIPEVRLYLDRPYPDPDTKIDWFVRILASHKKGEHERTLLDRAAGRGRAIGQALIALLLAPFLSFAVGTLGLGGLLAGGGEAATGAALLGPVGWAVLAVAVVAVGAYVVYNEMSKVDEESKDIPKTDAPTTTQECNQAPDPEKERSIRSLKKRLEEHRQKLKDYQANPDAYDNQGFLKNAPSPEVRQRIIDGRVRHLENEIKNFEKQINDLEGC